MFKKLIMITFINTLVCRFWIPFVLNTARANCTVLGTVKHAIPPYLYEDWFEIKTTVFAGNRIDVSSQTFSVLKSRDADEIDRVMEYYNEGSVHNCSYLGYPLNSIVSMENFLEMSDEVSKYVIFVIALHFFGMGYVFLKILGNASIEAQLKKQR